ncbi:ATP-binding cassette domain-containing protein [Actinomyces israelii]|jgi:daunorubicin resistance ABC transporter, ATP-binding protein|uniref:ATP-binding cassette domain-containing protein n=1 Tax=Actinomyces israelii TaxID=1659 RepID=UPI002354FBA7|nr:ATP-binding cassette domain-containing protein [Actinomyces israelii]
MKMDVRAEGLVKTFGKTLALDGVDLAVPRGSVLGVLGPNGAGKTTLVRILATLSRPDSGTVRVAGCDAVRDPVAVRARIGLTGQYASVDEELTGQENLILIGRLLGLRPADSRARANDLLDRFGMQEASGRPVKTYSGGMRRRIDLALSLVGRPEVLFLDEPTTGLDPRSREDLWSVVRELRSDGMTVLLTTQYLEEADQLADRITVIDHGVVVAEGTPQELKRETGAQTLVVKASDPGRVGRLVQIVRDIHGSEPVVAPDGVTVTVPTDDPLMLSAIVRRLDADGIATDEVALRLPSLDDAFFALTGRPATERPANPPAIADSVEDVPA